MRVIFSWLNKALILKFSLDAIHEVYRVIWTAPVIFTHRANKGIEAFFLTWSLVVFSDRKYLTIDQLLSPLNRSLVRLLLKGPLPEAVSYCNNSLISPFWE